MPAAKTWHKWRQILPALRLARGPLGLNRSRLDLLEKIMACVPGDLLATGPDCELIVHVSNARLAEMTNRDGDKTVTRLISELVALRLLARKSSPNGKRYMRQAPDGSRTAYGLDLAPLLARMPEIAGLAEAAELEAETCRRLRERCSLMLRQIEATDAAGDLLAEARRVLRRKPVAGDLCALLARLATFLPEPEAQDVRHEQGAVRTEMPATGHPGGTAPQNGCHKYPRQNPSDRFASSELSEASKRTLRTARHPRPSAPRW
ncbi:helix-turn-helix domain-containing protein [Mangrovicoccus ximenensis]|uniref:helix-turn-helix domain-containing protein n=1 Tax=Mangrovicoccus ximenensis TaxID=1911570 RepID=UPI001374D28D|nr:helix-turn-helix domain-containing protein [Mangrovicoccus ximenensis]